MLDTGLALGAARVVGGGGERPLDLAADDHNTVVTECDRDVLELQRTAIEEQRVPALADSACELVHDAAKHVGVIMLNVLAELDHVDPVHVEAHDLLQ